jgi:cytochrome oxidase Cu insertion factor (SCO1/SenC/PrrC family)
MRCLVTALPILALTLGAATAASAGEVALSAQDVRPLLVGASVPAVTLATTDGEEFDLAAAVSGTPTVLIFYRGGW